MPAEHAGSSSPHIKPRKPASGSVDVRFRLREFATPPVHDALVLGRQSSIGCVAVRKALTLLQTAKFEHIEFEDDVISDIIVRDILVRIIGRERLIELVKLHVKPFMTDHDMLHLDIDAELHVEAEG